VDRVAVIAALSALCRANRGVFRGHDAVALGVRRTQLGALCERGILVRELPDVYRMMAVPRSDEQRLRGALLWAGASAAGDGRSAGWWYGFEGVRARRPEIVVAGSTNPRCAGVATRRVDNVASLMIRGHRGLRVTGVEATLTRLAYLLEDEALEIVCEDARRQQLTSMPALYAYLDRHARRGQAGIASLRHLLAQLDPQHPSRSTLEVKARRLLVAHGFTDFVREFPLDGPRRTYFFDFAFCPQLTIFETTGKRWHDDPLDYEDGNEKLSIPGLHGYKLIMATWDKVVNRPDQLIDELRRTLAA
jgi:hypothetical protein